MNIIEINILKLQNLSKNIKNMFESFTSSQIKQLNNIINQIYKHAVNQNTVLNSSLLQVFKKLNAKFNTNISNGKIQFPQINYSYDTNYYSKIYYAYLSKLVSFLQKNINNIQQWQNLFDLINSNSLQQFTKNKSNQLQNNQIYIAQPQDVLIQKSALQNIILSDINMIDFLPEQEQTVDAIKVKLSVGNKHQQIKNSDATTLVDINDIKNYLFES